MAGLCLGSWGLMVAEFHQGDKAEKGLCVVVFQLSSFLLNLEMKVAIRTDTSYNVFTILWNTQF